MTRTYECMFLVDNDVVRAGWQGAKQAVAELLGKHGGSFVTSRRWAERRLAYPIGNRNRATYLLAYSDLDPTQMNELRRDLDISETVLRYLILAADAVPAEERELSAAEDSSEFVVPEPPADDAVDEPRPTPEEGEETKARAEGGGGTPKEAAPAEAPAAEPATEETKAATEPATEETKAADEPATVTATKTEGEEA